MKAIMLREIMIRRTRKQNMNYNKKTIKNRKIKNGIMIITFIISTALTPKLNAFTK